MNIKTSIIIWLFLIGTMAATQAQNVSDHGGQGTKAEQAALKIAALRKGYLTDKLALTPEEAAAFWPIYEEYKRKERALNQKAKKTGKKPFDQMTEKEAEQFIKRHLQLEEDRLELKKTYFAKMGAVIPMKKLIKLPRAERSFKMEVMKRMKKQRHGGKRPGGK